MKNKKEIVDALLARVSTNLFDINFNIECHIDKIYQKDGEGRLYLQCSYISRDTDNPNHIQKWGGRKWYLSEFMTNDEIIKTAWCAFEACVKHEIMEAFKVDGIRLFNPHVNFEELLKISNREVKRD